MIEALQSKKKNGFLYKFDIGLTVMEQKEENTTKDKVRAYKKFLYEYYCELFIYMEQRRERMEQINEKLKSLPEQEREAKYSSHCQKETAFLRQKRRRMKLGEFQLLALLGKGSFGSVYLCKKSDTGEILALKKMEKTTFNDQNKVSYSKNLFSS